MKNIIWEILCFLLLCEACSEDKMAETEVDSNAVNLNLSTIGAGTLENYIKSLTIIAFKQAEDSSFVYSQTITLDSLGLTQLSSTSSIIDSLTDTRTYTSSLEKGTYKLYFVANAIVNGISITAKPSDIYLSFSETGIAQPYFTSECLIALSESKTLDIDVVLHRIVSQLNVTITDIPSQIYTVKCTLDDAPTSYSLTGNTSGTMTFPICFWVNTEEELFASSTISYSNYTLPMSEATLSFVFRTYNGVSLTKTIVLNLDQDTKTNLNVTIGRGVNTDFMINVVIYFSVLSQWSDYSLPDIELGAN